jgi:hypothetical protein
VNEDAKREIVDINARGVPMKGYRRLEMASS